MVGCKVVLRNEMISYSCFATLMRSFKSLKQAFYRHENNST
nr:MAG TPA: ribosomal L5P family protein [Bacteriophage sp.]